MAFVFSLIISNFSGAPYVPSNDEKLKTMLKLAKIKNGTKVADIGSGNGKVVIAMAKLGAEAHGYEINPFLVWRAKQNVKKAGVEKNAHIHWRNFWYVNFSKFEVVTLYGITWIMKRLEKKLRKELKKGSIVVSNYFQFPNWHPSLQEDKILVYIKK